MIGDFMNVKVVRMISGEELVGDWNEEENSISNPVVMVPMSKEKLGFAPWLPYAKEQKFILKDQHIMVVGTPDTNLQNEYNRVFGSGLIVPEADKLIH